MIYDTKAGAPPLLDNYEFCIIGSGPAGITLALKLAEGGKRVVVLEAGGRDFTSESQEVYEGDNLGLDFHSTDISRLRYLGGTSGHWTGRCLLLDPTDFEVREDVPLSGWPISFDDIVPYQAEAAEILGVTNFGQVREPLDDTGILDVVEQQYSSEHRFYNVTESESRRFGTYYYSALEESKEIDVVLNANLTEFSVDSATGRVTHAQYQDYNHNSYEVRADTFVMAMGGIENSRFMLHLNEAQNDRFGNQGGMVGRCFMDHLRLPLGVYFITKRLYSHSPSWEFERLLRRIVPQIALSPSLDFARKNKILNGVIRLDRLHRRPLYEDEIGTSEFMRSLKYDEDYFFVGQSFVFSEQAPNPNSRVILTDKRDKFGLKKIGVDVQIVPKDIETLRRVALETAEFFIRSGFGRMQVNPALWNHGSPEDMELDFSMHSMGGLRMTETPETGVVDSDCRVHGAQNLYAAGSSVFPSGGMANPTFTIVQLALRLADHLLVRAG
jgi:choline dehydrogenase-like flavoprotein